MKIEYVGRQSPHRERLYKTGVTFAGPGDVKEVEDKVGKLMVDRHPDQYAAADPNAQPKVAQNPAPAPTAEQVADKGQPEGDSSGEGETDKLPEGVITLGGETKPIKDIGREVLIDIAKRFYNESIPTNTRKDGVVEIVTKLVADKGQPEAD